MPKPIVPAALVAFLQARREFADATPLGSIPQGIAFGDYQLFRIAEALELIAEAQASQAFDPPDPDPEELWKGEPDEDE